MEYRDYTTELSNLCASCKKDIFNMLSENNCLGITFNNGDDEDVVLTAYDRDGVYRERTMEFCKFHPKDDEIPYDRFTLTDVDGNDYSMDALTENDLMVLYDCIYNHFHNED